MAKGYYLLVGDKTTCGGVIITGDQTITFNGRQPPVKGIMSPVVNIPVLT